MTAEQLEAARAERMRQNGHGAITIEDVRTWIEETGLCIFLPRSAQAGFTAPTFVEAVAGRRTTEPTLELIGAAESLLVRLEAEGVAVRLSLSGQPGDQPDYVVAGWVLPYIYALRGDRDWRRSPQLTGSRQVSPLAVQAAKQLETANLNAAQIRDALGRETTETAVLRALHELWRQLRVIPVVPEVAKPAIWQPLRQRFQKAIAEGASTSQVTAISVLASIYLQAVIAASMEDVEMFLSPLTSRSKIREVVRGLAATRQVHSTTIGHGPMYYVAGTLPEFPATPSYQSSATQSSYRSSGYRTPSYLDDYSDSNLDDLSYSGPRNSAPVQLSTKEEDSTADIAASTANGNLKPTAPLHAASAHAAPAHRAAEPVLARRKPAPRSVTGNGASSGKAATSPRPRAGKASGTAHPHPRERSRTATGSPAARSRNASFSNGNGRVASGSNGHHSAKPAAPAKNGAHKSSKPAHGTHGTWSHAAGNGGASNGSKPANGARSNRPSNRPESRSTSRTAPAVRGRSTSNGSGHASATPNRNGVKPVSSNGTRSESRNRAGSARPVSKTASRPATRSRAVESTKREPAASKRYSFAGQAKQAPKSASKRPSTGRPASASSRSSRPAPTKRRG